MIVRPEESVNVAATDKKDRPARPSRTSTIIIRWLREDCADADPDTSPLRGTVLDLAGHTLGHFAGRDALFDLVGSIVDPPERHSQRSV